MATAERDREEELRLTGEAMAKLAEDGEAFQAAVEAVRAGDAERFQATLGKIGLLQHCHLICRFLCSKHCVWVCRHLVGAHDNDVEFDLEEVREFSALVARIVRDEEVMKALLEAVDNENADLFRAVVEKLDIHRFAHQLCHWLCIVRCRLVCRLLCPPPPLITEIGEIPTNQFDASGYASGPSVPPVFTPAVNHAAGIGHHPFGGLTKINGVFNVAGATEYKVERATAPGGPWTAITTGLTDGYWDGTQIVTYTRVPSGDWYLISGPPGSGMGLFSEGQTYLTDWPTPAAVSDLYYLKLTVRNAALTEFASPVYTVMIDNTAPTVPQISLAIKAPDGTVTPLGCCEEVDRGDGNVLVVTLQTQDANFSEVSVRLIGSCGVSLPIDDVNGVSLSKTYNGNTADTGYPVPTSFDWDPWAAGVDPCCYLVHVRTLDRAIVSNQFGNRHDSVNWHSITIA